MGTRTKQPDAVAAGRESGLDAELEAYLAAHHGEIEAKLDEARSEIDAGKAGPLEPLSDLMRDARLLLRSKTQ